MPPSSAALMFAGNTPTNVAAARKPPNRRVRWTRDKRGPRRVPTAPLPNIHACAEPSGRGTIGS